MSFKIDRVISKIKITTSITLISVVALVTAIALSGISYYKISILQDNISNMYNTDLLNTETGRKMSSSIGNIQTDIKNQLVNYNPKLDSTISKI